jgi:hypothetical protein
MVEEMKLSQKQNMERMSFAILPGTSGIQLFDTLQAM